jgi:hypothetical protein
MTTDIAVVPPPVGEGINSHEQFEAMPIGTTVAPINSPNEVYTKFEDGWSLNGGRRSGAVNTFSLNGFNAVVSYPAGYTPTRAPLPTLRQFQWRFRDSVTARAEMHGVDYRTVRQAMADMGVTGEFPAGVGMKVTSVESRTALPDGSVVLYGDPAQGDASYGMWVKRGGRFEHLLGGVRNLPRERPVIVHNVGGEEVQQDWLAETGDEEADRAIRAFKAVAWRVGAKVRAHHQWCSTFDSIMNQAGVSSSDLQNSVQVNGVYVGDQVDPLHCADLPLGTILRWRHSDHPTTRVIWFERVDGATNAAGTRRIFGYRDDAVRQGGYADRMQVMYLPNAEFPEPNLDVDLSTALPHLPVGTVLHIGADTTRYMLCQDRRWRGVRADSVDVPATGSYTFADLGDPRTLRIVRFGAPS